tara:strand:+ start:278 stop:838 length:561 start_codon:yes stop_codon:yes gene_type:complete
MKKLFDISLCIFFLSLLLLPFIIILFIIIFFPQTKIIHWSNRVGKNNIIFKMPKFRTMKLGTPDVATHLLENPKKYVTYFGTFLRRTSLDEIPQIWSILKGEMSFVGPRPALHNQHDLIELRTKLGVHKLLPGLTGLAQIYGRDDLPIPEKVKFDVKYLENQSFLLDCKIIFFTIVSTIMRKGVSH